MTVEADEGDDGLTPNEAFELLGHETRVAILRALWDAFESAGRDNDRSYTELFKAVDIRDSGNFSYHLQKLTGPYIRSTDEGYELKQTGINVMRAVVEGTVTDNPSFGPTQIDLTCPICRSPVELTYQDELMTIACTECEGRIPWDYESGHLFGAPVPPAAIADRPIEEAFESGIIYTLYQIAAFLDGVCSDCSSYVETTVDVCPNHAPGETLRCPRCDRLNLAEVWMACPTCKLRVFAPASLYALNHSKVAAKYHEHGIDHRFASWETVDRSYQVGEKLVSADPLVLQLTIPMGDDEEQVTIEGGLAVCDSAA